MSLSTLISSRLRLRRGGAFIVVFLAAILLTWGLYVLAAKSFLNNSIVLRSVKDMVEAKLTPLRVADRGPYVIVVSGSNALYSIDSPTLSKALGTPVSNLAVQWSYTYYVLEQIVRLARPKDMVLLPIEYEYFETIDDFPKLEACYLIFQDRTTLSGILVFAQALRQCSPRLVLDAFAATAMSALGARYPRQPITEVISAEGDILENTADENRWRQPTSSARHLPRGKPFGNDRLASLLQAIAAKGASVYLSFPVRPEKSGRFPVVTHEWRQALEQWATAQGATIVSDPENHVFPVHCFFDSPYHLHRGCSPRNSLIYATALAAYLRQR